MNKFSYNQLLKTRTGKIWKRIGINRRAGVVIPLFSIYSGNSVGIGEIPDLNLVVDWCVKTGISIIQLLPLNETGIDFAPYNAISSFALEPMYLCITELRGVSIDKYKTEIFSLKKTFGKRETRIDFSVKKEKLKLLRKIYLNADTKNNDFIEFISNNKYWLKDYATYKIFKQLNKSKPWEEWRIKSFNLKNTEFNSRILFLYWLQWQLYEQMKNVKAYAKNKGVFLTGDLPFLSARDSADVWAHQKYFKLELSAGAPPDMYFAFGQKWGMPPYNWNEIRKDSYVYLKEKLRYAENFYDMYRIDHFVGLFRIWITEASPQPSPKERGFNDNTQAGRFDPEQEVEWENHGKKIINVMLRSSSMLPCAEDLGTVPECSYKTLREYGIPGIDFQRFNKNKKYEFTLPNKYRINSTAVISTHDSSFFPLWWDFEAGTIDKQLFEYLCRLNNIKGKRLDALLMHLFDKTKSQHGRLYWHKNISKSYLLKTLNLTTEKTVDILKLYNESYGEKQKFLKSLYGKNNNSEKTSAFFQYKCLEAAGRTASIFSIQLLHEYLFLDRKLFGMMHKWSYRINQPGTENYRNWSVTIPCSLEELLKNKALNSNIRSINRKSQRGQQS